MSETRTARYVVQGWGLAARVVDSATGDPMCDCCGDDTEGKAEQIAEALNMREAAKHISRDVT